VAQAATHWCGMPHLFNTPATDLLRYTTDTLSLAFGSAHLQHQKTAEQNAAAAAAAASLMRGDDIAELVRKTMRMTSTGFRACVPHACFSARWKAAVAALRFSLSACCAEREKVCRFVDTERSPQEIGPV
jgi:hypothetical protein